MARESHHGSSMNTKSKTELLTLSNDFHGTECQVRVPVGTTPWEAWADASPRKQARIRALLCGAAKGNCSCGVVRMSVSS